MQIREVMTREVEVIHPDMAIRDAAARMRDADTGFLPVGENDRLVGTLTDRDITVRCTAQGADPSTAKVREAMSQQLVYCFEDQDTEDAARLMGEKQIRRLPILNRDKRLVGVLSLGDIAERAHARGTTGEAMEGIARHTGKPSNA